MKKISSEGKDLRMMGILMGMPLYIDTAGEPDAPDPEDPSKTIRDRKEVQARAILYRATQALVGEVGMEQQNEKN